LLSANLIFSVFSYVLALKLDGPGVLNFYELPRSWFVQETRIMVSGTIALAFDFLLLIVIYEAFHA
jgi:hypothetical protein